MMEWFWLDLSSSQADWLSSVCFDAIDWVIWPVKIVHKMTYGVEWYVKPLHISHSSHLLGQYQILLLEDRG